MSLRHNTLIAFCCCVALAGCSERQLYQIGQDVQRENCRDRPAYEYDDCMAEANRSFEDYQQERNAGAGDAP